MGGGLLHTPQLKRRRVVVLAGEHHSGNQEHLKKVNLLDMDFFRSDARHFVPNPNRPKQFDFKRENKPPEDLDETTLIDFEKCYRRPLVVDSSASPYLGRILHDGTLGETRESTSTVNSNSLSFVEKARRFGSLLDFKLRLGNVKKVKPPRDAILLKVKLRDKVCIFTSERAEKVYLPLESRLGEIMQLLVITFYDKYPGRRP